MILKEIRLFGFKSFGEKVSLLLSPGMTVICGPNGCGKSNLLEALRWLFGGAARQLRSSSMQELLFSAAGEKRGSNLAEVTCLFSITPEEGELPYSEVEISRRLYRQGESSYFFNREKISQEELLKLCSRFGITRSALSLFEQGTIDRLLRLTPSERFLLFEELTALAHFTMTKENNLLKLAGAEEKLMTRSQTLLHKREWLIKLKERADRYRRQLEKKEERKEVERALCHLELQRIVNRLSLEEARLNENEVTLHGIQEDLQGKREEITILHDAIIRLDCFVQTLQGEMRALEEKKVSEKQRLLLAERKKRVLQERQGEVEAAFLRLKKESEERTRTLTRLREEMGRLQQRCEEERLQLISLEGEKEGVERLYREENSRLHEMKALLEPLYQDLSQCDRELVRLKSQERERQKEREGLLRQLEEERRKKHSLEKELLQRKLEQVRMVEEKTTLELALEKAREKAHHLRRVEEESAKKLLNLKVECKSASKELELLQAMESRQEGVSDGAKALLREGSNVASPLFGKLFALHERIRSLCREPPLHPLLRRGDGIIVENKESLRELFSLAQERGIHGYFVLSLAAHEGSLEKALRPFLCDKAASLTHDGLFTQPYLFFDGGIYGDGRGLFFCDSAPIERSPLDRSFQLEKVEQKRLHLMRELEREETSHRQVREEHLVWAGSVERYSRDLFIEEEKLKRADRDLTTLLLREKRTSSSMEELQRRADHLDLDGRELPMRIAEYSLRNATLEEQKTKLRAEESLLNKTLRSITENLQSKERRYKELQRTLFEGERSLTHKREMVQEQLILDQKEAILLVKLEEEKRVAEVASQRHEGEESELSSSLQLIDGELQRKRTALEENLRLFAEEHKVEKAKKESIRRLEREEENQRRQREKHLLLTESLRKEREALAARWDGVSPSLLDKESDLRSRLSHLNQEIQNLGSFDETLFAEEKSLEEELKEEEKLYTDITQSISELKSMIALLDEEYHAQAKSAFTSVNRHFQSHFATLFRGGSGSLKEVVDGDRRGLEIEIELPGKGKFSQRLLSGGERSLVAIALQAAFFSHKPTPFCLMDEVDAALDERNVDGVLDLFQQLKQKTQLLLITHHRKTMEMADTLVGVTLTPKGSSKIISIQLQEEQRREELLT